MSILIKGMEMPKDCLKCPFCLFADGYWKCLVDGSHADFGGTCRPQNCPLVPVPAHGDLVDRSKIEYTYQMQGGVLMTSNKIIDRLPTIIPAEEGER